MRVFGRAFVLGFLLVALAPAAASAAPLLARSPGASCSGLVAAPTANCGVFTLDPFSAAAITGEFLTDRDVALFAFAFTEETLFSVTTSSYGEGNFDPSLGLFRRSGPSLLSTEIVTFPNPLDPAGTIPARNLDIEPEGPNYDDHLALTLGPGAYLLALLKFGNDFTTPEDRLLESVVSGFVCDSDDLTCFVDPAGSQFSFSMTATPVDGGPAPVPEPATLTLVAGGAIVGLLQRRRTKRRQSSAVSR